MPTRMCAGKVSRVGQDKNEGLRSVVSPLSTANGSLEAHRTARRMHAGAITYLLASVVLLMERASARMATEAFAPLGAVMVMDLMLPETGRQAGRQVVQQSMIKSGGLTPADAEAYRY